MEKSAKLSRLNRPLEKNSSNSRIQAIEDPNRVFV